MHHDPKRLRELFDTLSPEERWRHADKIARFRIMAKLPENQCRFCGRPTAGFVPAGMTMDEVGICTC